MNILITAGGTIEKIDEVRFISNNSTGLLGTKIAEAFIATGITDKVFYVCGKNAAIPQNDKITIRRVASVSDLETELKDIMSKYKIDAVVHSMAVSDYAVSAVTSYDNIFKSVNESLQSIDFKKCTKQDISELIFSGFKSEPNISVSGKISSDIGDLVVIMKKTPKIIGLIKQMQPNTILVGFKLLNNVPVDVLLKTGYSIMEKNKCDLVFANDLKDVNPENHSGYLIKSEGTYKKITGKSKIAAEIVSAVIEILNKERDTDEKYSTRGNGQYCGI
ncbi:MAG: phosphopantothenoylcysteine decarboxylase [Bacillota bacterium]|nr:phosphopantothenoylcysteine decarboxylase [Bacillota bacterium]